MSVPSRHLGWSIVKNIGGQSVGRLMLTFARFVIAAVIIKIAGKDSFGEYTVVLSLLTIGEWLVDFGLTDIAVRGICREPSAEPRTLAALAFAKLVQGAIGCTLIIGVAIIGYSRQIALAAAIGCIGVLAYAAAQIFRAHFKARMRMERDVAAEVLSVLVMAPLTFIACRQGLGLPALVACMAFSRVVFLLAMWALSRGHISVRPGPGVRAEAKAALLTAIPLGLSGLCAAVFDQLDTFLLFSLKGPADVAHYSGAMRFVWPITVIVQAIAGSVFPILAASWKKDEARFRLIFQRSMDLSVFVAVGAIAAVSCGSDAMISLFGSQMSEAAVVLRIVVWAIFARAINNALVASFIVAGGIKYAFLVSILGLGAKFAVLRFAIPWRGAEGAAYADVLTEWITGVLPVLYITQRLIGFRVQWIIVLKTGAAAALAVAITQLLHVRGGWIGLGIAAAVFPTAALALRAIAPSELRMLGGSVKGRFASKSEGAP